MDRRAFEQVDPSLRIGYDCFLMDVSAIFESLADLSYSLTFTDFDFLYNRERIIEFVNPRPPKDYISETNELVIEANIDSRYHLDFEEYYISLSRSYQLFDVVDVRQDYQEHLLEFELPYLENNIPLLLPCDHFYLYDAYARQVTNILQYHSRFHSIVLAGINLENRLCSVIDKFFHFKGEVSADNYVLAIQSQYINHDLVYPKYVTFLNHPLNHCQVEERLRVLLKKNIERTLLDETHILGVPYMKNIKALHEWITDFPEILHTMENLKGPYAPQFTTRLFQLQMLQRVSFANLMGYIGKTLHDAILYQIAAQAEEVSKLWLRIDSLCDVCFLRHESLVSYRDQFDRVLAEIYELEVRILSMLCELHGRIDV